MELGLVGGNYDSKPLSAQETINMYPEVSELRSRSNFSLKPTPGLVSFANVGTGPIRGMMKFNSLLYVVSGSELYEVSSTGTGTLKGTISGTGRVGMAINAAATPQLIIVNGAVGAPGGGYIYTTSLASISDADFPGADVVHNIDTYFIVNEPGTQKFYISSPGDGTTWAALDFASKEGAPYNLVTLIPNHRDIFLFGEKTYEVWRNTGNVDFTFERQEGTFQERGCIAKHSVAELDNTVFFLGDDRIVYKIDGYLPVRVSNHALEESLGDYTLDEVSTATAFTYTEDGHYFYVLNVANDTWVYDSTMSQQVGNSFWHKRQTGLTGRWRCENYENIYGKHLCGDRSTGNIWELDRNTNTDNGEEILRSRTVAPFYNDGKFIYIKKLLLKMKTGTSGSSDGFIWLELSKDGGDTWGNKLYRTVGQSGQRTQQIQWKQVGRSRDWTFRLSSTDDLSHLWMELHADVEVGGG